MIVEHLNGEPASAGEHYAVGMMMHNIRHTLHKDPIKVVLLEGFKAAAALARHTANYQLLSRECELHL